MATAAAGIGGGLLDGGLAAAANAVGGVDSVLRALEGDGGGDGAVRVDGNWAAGSPRQPKARAAGSGLTGGAGRRKLLGQEPGEAIGDEPGPFDAAGMDVSGVRPELSVT